MPMPQIAKQGPGPGNNFPTGTQHSSSSLSTQESARLHRPEEKHISMRGSFITVLVNMGSKPKGHRICPRDAFYKFGKTKFTTFTLSS